jgi:hypothetical protein
MKSFYHVHMIALYYSVSFHIDHSHPSCQVRDDSVSHKTKNRKNKQTYFFQFQWNAQRQTPPYFLFLSIFTLICIHWNDGPLASSHIWWYYSASLRCTEKEREGEGERGSMCFSFSLVRNRRAIDSSLHILNKFARTNNECYPNRTIHFFFLCYHSLSLSRFLLFSILCKEKHDANHFSYIIIRHRSVHFRFIHFHITI